MKPCPTARPRRLATALAALCTVPVLAAHAASRPLPSESEYFQTLPVVLTASRLPNPKQTSPVAVTVIDRQMIEASGAREIEDLLRLAPGMIVGHDDGSTGFATYHAFADRFARRMQVLVDGRSVYTPTFGGVPWSSLPLDINDIQRIEIIRGPDAAAYGSNAFLGTISITTRRPQPSRGGEAELMAGNDHIYKVLGRYDGRLGNGAYRVTASAWGDDGFDNLRLQRDSKNMGFASGRYDFSGPAGGLWQLQFGVSRGHQEAGRYNTVLTPPHNILVRYQYEQATWRSSANPDHNIRVRFYHERDTREENFTTEPIVALGGIQATLNQDVRGDRYDAEFQQTLRPLHNLRMAWGLSTRQDNVHSPSFLGTDDTIHNNIYRLFNDTEWEISPRNTAELGLMAEHTDIGGDSLSPRLALNHSLSPSSSLRLGASRATRTPVVIEEHANQRFSAGSIFDQVFLSSGNLEPEKITSYELGYVSSLMHGRLDVDTRVFSDHISDLITYYPIPYPDTFDGWALDFRNRDHATVRGAEMQLDYRPASSDRIVFNYAYTRLTSSDIDEHYSDSAPRHNVSILAMHHFDERWSGSAGFYYTSTMDGLDTGTTINPMKRLDLRLAWRPEGTRPGPEVSLVAQSVLGSYEDFRYDNLFDRRIFADIRIPFDGD
ncbi:MAG: TonB-dependent receptor [Gammaproteobacteria bacterium]|jgi:iron complex outermembrane receptor protein